MKNAKAMGISKEKAQKELDVFLNNIKSVILSTVDKDGEPFASYSPFVEDEEGNFYVFISTAVKHSHNMYTTGKAHILFIEDESNTAHIYGRRRLYFNAKAEKFEPEDERFEKIATLFEKKLGDQGALVRSMVDSRIYKLTPYNGNIVLGFGAAYKLDKSNKKIETQKTMKGKAHSQSHEEGLKEHA
ncbi:HugZ family protein [Halarcobacter ebronensis]|uniref:Pyridoxamine 5-phosphate oxidase n=1 Tax=Halarcobacter ebronensis TaxID=1462615 RepID=A0A4Q1AMV3_9BACT|nr:pyridoxamine 5'-phosphate oxidase family protein [Halarcobacter ebronensis]QKF82829.1 heme utilization protein HutZ [Halarcobacter ebronensis]RXK06850.1 pyridoxamine 5-phosphate oxidase [Halarcobacter ebronensis]